MIDTAVLLLAGGVGSRLSILVSKRAKPAVPFAGIYRIIDFTLSNIARSSLASVAVLTQYKPLSLMDHIGNGSSWDLSGRFRSARILPPKTGEKEWDWYKGTADAVRQNISFIKGKNFKHVLIVSGDHVYHMDYGSMIRYHEERQAKVTISMIEVPWEQTSQFGTAIADENGRIVDWEEKSPTAHSNLASMGIYVFDTDYLIGLLETTKEIDFGHHIIPMALQEGTVFAYPFSGYWRDVGTVQAYWEANMDLLDISSGLNPESWGTMTNVNAGGLRSDRPPTKIITKGSISNSAISPGCIIRGTVENSILSPGVVIEKGAHVKDSVIMHDCVVRENCRLERCIADKKVIFGANSIVGGNKTSGENRLFPEHLNTGITLIGKEAAIPPNTQIGVNCIIYSEIKEHDFPDSHLPDGESLMREGTRDE